MNDDASVGQSFSRQGHIVRTYRDASWWLKLDRAEKHLVELNDAIAAYESRRLHEVSKRVESKRKPNEWLSEATSMIAGLSSQGTTSLASGLRWIT
jgi:hypothetical protein